MASHAQTKANRRNASKSTGPKSPQGKSVARLNAVKHGLTASRVVLPDEDAAEFEALRDELERELEPVGRQETDLVETIAMDMWRKRRFYQMEADIMAFEQAETELRLAERELRKFEQPIISASMSGLLGFYDEDHDSEVRVLDAEGEAEAEENGTDAEYLAAKAKADSAREKLNRLESRIGTFLLADPKYPDALEKLIRYQAGIDRSLGRARDQLARLQRDREARTALQATVINEGDHTKEESG